MKLYEFKNNKLVIHELGLWKYPNFCTHIPIVEDKKMKYFMLQWVLAHSGINSSGKTLTRKMSRWWRANHIGCANISTGKPNFKQNALRIQTLVLEFLKNFPHVCHCRKMDIGYGKDPFDPSELKNQTNQGDNIPVTEASISLGVFPRNGRFPRNRQLFLENL